ncbi:MAG: hypothetical protein JXR75_13670 [Rhodobacteraceae bacterium]|nr:hypothetical protein [Paracoccaceae bacterium]
MKALPHVLLAALCLSACMPAHVDLPHPPREGDGRDFAPVPELPPPGPDGGWTIGQDGEPTFIGQPEPNPPALEG